MNPIHLPKTLAAIGRQPEDSLVKTQATEGHLAKIAMALREELSASMVPMEDYLERGGWPELVAIDVRGVRDQGKQMEVLLTLRFIEHTPAACPSSSKPETRIAYMKASLDRATARAVLVDDS